MRSPAKLHCLLSLTALTVAACGGGGGGSTTTARLEGTLTVPSLSTGPGRLVEDAGLNDVAHQAQRVGRLSEAGALTIEGQLAAGDARDVFHLDIDAGVQVALGASHGVVAEVFDAHTGDCLGTLPCSILSTIASSLHLVVVSDGRDGAYRVDVLADAKTRADVVLPRGTLAAQSRAACSSVISALITR